MFVTVPWQDKELGWCVKENIEFFIVSLFWLNLSWKLLNIIFFENLVHLSMKISTFVTNSQYFNEMGFQINNLGNSLFMLFRIHYIYHLNFENKLG